MDEENSTKMKALVQKDVRIAWQSSVMERLSDFALITTLVVQQTTRTFLANQEETMRNRMIKMIKDEFLSKSGTVFTKSYFKKKALKLNCTILYNTFLKRF